MEINAKEIKELALKKYEEIFNNSKKELIWFIEATITEAANKGFIGTEVSPYQIETKFGKSYNTCDHYKVFIDNIQIFIDELEEAGFNVKEGTWSGISGLKINWN